MTESKLEATVLINKVCEIPEGVWINVPSVSAHLSNTDPVQDDVYALLKAGAPAYPVHRITLKKYFFRAKIEDPGYWYYEWDLVLMHIGTCETCVKYLFGKSIEARLELTRDIAISKANSRKELIKRFHELHQEKAEWEKVGLGLQAKIFGEIASIWLDASYHRRWSCRSLNGYATDQAEAKAEAISAAAAIASILK